MSENMDYTPDLYTLVDEDGKEQEFEMLDAMEQDGQKYYALIPYHENAEEVLDDDGELVILKSDWIDDEETLVTIDDDTEYDKIGQLFLERIQSIFDESNEDDDCDGDCDCGCHCHDNK